MSFLKNANIGFKIGVIPVLPLIGIAIIAWLALSLVNTQSASLNKLNDQNYAKTNVVADISFNATMSQSELYRAMTWSVAGVEAEKITMVIETAARFREKANKDLMRLEKDFPLNEIEKKLVKEIDTQMTDYVGHVEAVLSMLDLDFTAAVSFLFTAQESHSILTKKLDQFVDNSRKEVGREISRNNEESAAFVNQLLMLSAIVLIVSLVASSMIGRAVRNPVVKMTDTMIDLANGNLSVEIPSTDQKDEIGQMAKTVEVFKQNAIDVQRAQMIEAAKAEQIEAAKRQTMHQLADELENTVQNAVATAADAVEVFRVETDKLVGNAEQTTTQSEQVNHSSTTASENVDNVAGSAQRLNDGFGEIINHIENSTEIARRAVTQADQTNETVNSLSAASQRIGDVIELISAIADQTNLLALNATIEAARAGEAGKGFAVVASEVKNLANQTAKATEEISSEIQAIAGTTGEAVKAIRNIQSIIDEVEQALGAISSTVSKQGEETSNINSFAKIAADGTRTVVSEIKNVQSIAEDTGTSAKDMRMISDDLHFEISKLTKDMEELLKNLRAA